MSFSNYYSNCSHFTFEFLLFYYVLLILHQIFEILYLILYIIFVFPTLDYDDFQINDRTSF